MPDTLPVEWSWSVFPDWERTVLEGLSDLLVGKGYGTALSDPALNDNCYDVDYWYGIDIWLPKSLWRPSTWLGKIHLAKIYCLEHVLFVKLGSEPVLVLDLFDPASIDTALAAIAERAGSTKVATLPCKQRVTGSIPVRSIQQR